MNKRGMFFTFIAILLVLVILVAFLAKSKSSSPATLQKTQAKVTSLNAFVKSFDPVMERALQASAKQTMLGSLDYMVNAKPKRTYIPGFPAEFSKVMLTGKLSSGIAIAKMDQLNILKTLDIVKGVAEDSNIHIFHDPVTEQDITINHISPWEIEVAITLKNARVADNQDLNKAEISWSLGATRVIKTRLYVTDYSDPLVLVEEGRQLPIKKTLIQSFGSKQDLDAFMASHDFIAHGDGLSFLQRMSGPIGLNPPAFTVNPFGIEAVLDNNRGTDSQDTKSFVDFYYWGNLNDAQISCNVEGYPGNFRMDEKHKIFYTNIHCPGPR